MCTRIEEATIEQAAIIVNVVRPKNGQFFRMCWYSVPNAIDH